MDMRGFDQSGIKRLVDLAIDGILVIDHAGIVIECNSLAEEITGYPRDLLQGLSVDELVPENIRHHHPALRTGYNKTPNWRRMLSNSRDVDLVDRTGKLVAVDIFLAPLELNEKSAVVVVIRDQRQSRIFR